MQGDLTLDAERFRRDLLKLQVGGGPLLLAVSGGPDSMAMLALAHAAMPGGFHVATVNHRLADSSAEAAAMVASTCATLGIPHATLTPADPIAGASLQARARQARYTLLAAHADATGAVAIATAHHADDQAETFLMRAARGSGLTGLAGIRARGEWRTSDIAMPLVRPLIGWRRAELRAVVETAALPFFVDPANTDDRHDRTRVRRWLVEHPELDPAALARSAAHLAEAEADWRTIADWLWRDRRRPAGDGEVVIEVTDLPRTLRRLLARRAIDAVRATAALTRPAFTEATNMEALLDALDASTGGTLGGVQVIVDHPLWRFRSEPPRRA